MSIDYSNMAFPKNTKTMHKKYKSSFGRQRQDIKELFNYACALCGRKGTEVHHIVYRSEDRSKIHDKENMILLCTECHNKVHSNKKYWQPRLQEIREKINSK